VVRCCKYNLALRRKINYFIKFHQISYYERGADMSNNMKCSKCGKEISQLKLRYFSLFVFKICTHCGKINKLSFASKKDEISWISFTILNLSSILFYIFTLSIYRNTQADLVKYMLSLVVFTVSNSFLNSMVANGKVSINSAEGKEN